MIQVRALKPEEFPRLAGISDGFVPDPKHSIAIIGENDGEIAGRIFLLSPVHLEGPWLREDHRNKALGAQLVRRAEDEARRCGVTKLFAYAANGEIEDYLHRLGYKLVPMTVWEKDI